MTLTVPITVHTPHVIHKLLNIFLQSLNILTQLLIIGRLRRSSHSPKALQVLFCFVVRAEKVPNRATLSHLRYLGCYLSYLGYLSYFRYFPCKIRTDFGCRDFFSQRESRQDSRREAKFPAAKISPRSHQESRRDSCWEAIISAARISPGSCHKSGRDSRQKAKIPAAKISPGSYRESRRDSRPEDTSRQPKSRRDASANLGKILGGQNKSAILTGILTIFRGETKILGEIYLHKILAKLPRMILETSIVF